MLHLHINKTEQKEPVSSLEKFEFVDNIHSGHEVDNTSYDLTFMRLPSPGLVYVGPGLGEGG